VDRESGEHSGEYFKDKSKVICYMAKFQLHFRDLSTARERSKTIFDPSKGLDRSSSGN
jgi:hypothetical protein